MPSIEVEKLSAFYGKAQALSEISLQADKGEIIAIVGANGAGKSTLLDSIMGLVTCTGTCLLYTSPSPRDLSTSRMPSSA